MARASEITDHIEVLHTAIGRALARWQYIETGLYLIAHGLLGSSHKASSITFFHIKSAEAKLALVDKLILAFMPQRVFASEWKAIRGDVNDALGIRNAIAHFELIAFDPQRRPKGTKFDFALTPHHLDTNAGRSGTVKTLFVENLDKAADGYLMVARDLLRFVVQHVPNWQQQEASLPPDLQQVLETIRSEVTATAPRRSPRSSRE